MVGDRCAQLPDGQVWVSATFVEAVNADNVPVVEAPPLWPLLTARPGSGFR
ncbi:MAG: hypothetical protein IPJ94_27765 [Chloroflexi bacterium]|nr:hypothetical protein [Chloroflexota bacterium]